MLRVRGEWLRRLYSADYESVDPRSLELPAANIRAIHAAISATLLLLIAAFWVIQETILPPMNAWAGTVGLMPCLLASTAVALWPRPASPRVLLLIFLLDVIAITGCIHRGGGTEIVSGPMAYVVIIGLAGITLSESAVWVIAAVAAVSYATMAWAETAGWLPHFYPYMRSPIRQGVVVIMVSLGLTIAAAMVTYAVRNLRDRFQLAEIHRRESVARLSRLLQHPLEQCLAWARRIESGHGAQRLHSALSVRQHAAEAIELVHNVLETARLEALRPARLDAAESTVIGRAGLQRIFLFHSAVIAFNLAALLLLKQLVVPSAYVPAGTAALFLALVPNAIGALSTGRDLRWIAALAMAADILAVTYVIHLGGGIEATAGPMFYVIIVGVTGLIFAERAAFAAATAGALSYAALIWAEQTRLLDHYFPYTRSVDSQVAGIVLVSACLLLAAWVVSYAVRQLRAFHRRAEEIRGEAVSSLSHDLKNPLQVVYSYACLIHEVDEEEQTDMARRIQEASRRALDLVGGILDSASVEARPVTPRLEPVRVDEMLREVVDQFSLAASQKVIRLQASAAPDLPEIEADPELLARAISNLVSNAVKFTGGGGCVEVTATADEQQLAIAVRDTGMGISPEDRTLLFEKYARTRSAGSVEGTGLGLHIARSIAEAHGGAVELDSEVGRGSTFTLVLPVASESQRRSAA